MNKKCEKIFGNHKKCIEYIKEINGLVGAIDCDGPDKIRKLIKLYCDYEWQVHKMKQIIKWLIKSNHINKSIKKILENELSNINVRNGKSNHIKQGQWFEKLYQIDEELKFLYSILDNDSVNEKKVMKKISELEKQREQMIEQRWEKRRNKISEKEGKNT